ncbi:non-ribosomal peptide synthetase [Telmatospirillum sp.]|uniref:non-ribosomal peptide synthetase n=1 Tax=Telmatospirillum sp. TaxID=2079197 RepID=UPI00284E32FB|nr:non-ribosomal peptide synthetase [Telmatospirillum sp.]MDR3436285.1 amino acid adenylation domain-containing protein [Telmatospirillum sp.]
MAADALLQRLRMQDIRLSLDGDNLRFSAPSGAFTAELKAEVAARKPALIDLLRREAEDKASTPADEMQETEFPLPPALEGQWLDRRDKPGAVTYTLIFDEQVPLGTDPSILIEALNQIVARHAALRSTFRERDGDVWQIVNPPIPAVLLPFDDENLLAPFDLGNGPLIRFGYTAAGHTPLRIVADHLIYDGHSQTVFSRELSCLLAGRSLPPPPPADARAGETAHLTGQRSDDARRFWQSRLPRLPTAPISVDNEPSRARDAGSDGGRRHMVTLTATTVRALADLCTSSVTPTAVWLSLVAGFLWRHKDRSEPVAIGLAFAGRDTPGAGDMIGCFANVLPVTVQPVAESGIAALGRAVLAEIFEIMPHQSYPLSRLAADWAQLAPQRGTDLFDAVCMLDEDFLNQEIEDAHPHFATGKFPLLLNLIWQGERAVLNIEYDTGRYGEVWIERLSQRLQLFIEAAAAAPDAPLARLPLLAPGERQRLLRTFNDTARPYPRDLGLAQLLDRALSDDPDRPALSDATHVLSRREVRRRVAAIAGALHRDGVRPGDVVALAMERSTEAILGLLGIVWSGGAYLPLDPAFPPETVHRLLEAAGCRHVLAAAIDRQETRPDMTVTEISADAADIPPTARGGGDLAYILYTSGTTGEPKGVMVPHRAVARLVLGDAVPPGGIMAQTAPLAFDAATMEIWGALLTDGQLRVIAEASLFDPLRLEADLRDGDISTMWLTSSLLNHIVDERPQSFATLNCLLTGGEALSPPHIAKLRRACPNLAVINGYGPTENTTLTTTHVITAADLTGAPIPIGKPVANSRAYVLDADLQLVPIGVWGELFAAGDGLALGYCGRDDQIAFTAVDGIDEPRLYRTGDRVRWRTDGVLEFGGRGDGQVKVRGHRIETTAIQDVLTALPGIREAVVMAVDAGDGGGTCLGAVVVADDSDSRTWSDALAKALPAYMVPERFAAVTRLPLSGNGKADRAALAGLLRQGDSAIGAAIQRSPAPGLETIVADAFGRLFDGARIHAGSDFFDLGGHSLKAMRLAAILEHAVGTRPTLAGLMRARTVEAIARLLANANAPAAGPTIMPQVEGDDYPLSVGQSRLWVVHRLYPDSAAYCIPMLWDIHGALDPDALDHALECLEERHHALRLRFVIRPDDPDGVRQSLAPPGGLRLHRLELDDAAAHAWVASECLRPFAATDGPLARAALIRLDPEGRHHWLMLAMHHAIFDGGSQQILLRDLAAFYTAAVSGQTADLPALSRQLEDFAAWQRSVANTPESLAGLRRWVERLTPLPEQGLLPPDRWYDGPRRFAGATRRWDFPVDTLDRLNRQAEAASTTVFGVLAALVQVLLHRLSGRTDIALGLLVSGRNRRELDDVIGFFVNDVVLRQEIDPDLSFARHLETTREKLLEAMADQDVPFEEILHALPGGTHDGQHNPLFEVLVVWQDDPPAMPAIAGLSVVPVELAIPFAKFDLTFHFQRSGDDLRCYLEYNTDLYNDDSIDALAARLEQLAETLPTTGPLRDMPLLLPTEQERLRVFNDTSRPLPSGRTIPEPFLERVALAPEAPALLASGRQLDYATFAGLAAGLARRLGDAGVKPGDVVAVVMRRSADMLIAIHGILLAGAAYCPIDPDLPAARRQAMREDLGDPWFVADADATSDLPAHRLIAAATDDDVLADPPRPSTDPHGLAYVLFTSGSTGRPKGVEIEHHGVLNRILWMQDTFPIGSGDVILQKTPIGFDVSVWELLWWSWTGAAVAVPPPGVEKDPQALAAAIAFYRVTVIHFVPSMLRAFLTAIEAGRVAITDLATLRLVFSSGEALDVATVLRFNGLLHSRFGTELHNLYGPTEATVDVTWHPCSPWTGGTTVPIGRPIANTRVDIVDVLGRPLPPGAVGEILLAGPQVARGYRNRPELTAQSFLPDPMAPGERRYRTGDLGRWNRDGTIDYLGRIDDQVKVRGVRIEPGEIEAALESCDGVERGLIRAQVRDGMTELHAFVVGTAELNVAELLTKLRAKLPEAMIPSRFFRSSAVPLSANGKVDRKALSGVPLETAPKHDGNDGGPHRQALMALWRQVLPDVDFGTNDGFFDIGGNSLLLLRLHERIEARWPGVFRVTDLFSCSTIAAQADRLTGADRQPSGMPAVSPSSDAGSVAIIGMAVQVAGTDDLDQLWRDVAIGADLVGPLPAGRRASAEAMAAASGLPMPAVCKEAAYLDDVDGFDFRRFRFAPADAALVDPEQRLFLETALMALEDAGLGGRATIGARVGVYAGGNANPAFRMALARMSDDQAEQAFTLNVPSNLATRLGFLLNWRGPAAVIDTACSSGLVAVHAACRDLLAGTADMAIAGAARLILVPRSADSHSAIDSSTARTHAFSADADGTGTGEGAAVVVLKRLAEAVADGDAIHAVILGSAVNQDGASSGAAAPNPLAQAEVIRAAWDQAGADLASVSYIEAHGTGTKLGDPIEIDGLCRAMAGRTAEVGFAVAGSAKGNYGHLDSAAGILGLVRAVLTLAHDIAPPQPFFTAANPAIDFARAPVRVVDRPTPLADRGTPRRAGVSSFGLSGINAHVAIEVPPPTPTASVTDLPWVVVALSAGSTAALQSYATALRRHVAGLPPTVQLADIAMTLATGRDALSCRFAMALRQRDELLTALDHLLAGDGSDTATVSITRGHDSRPTVAAAFSRRADAVGAVSAFLAGADLTWPADQVARHRHLPPAPFSRQPCRLAATASTTTTAEPVEAVEADAPPLAVPVWQAAPDVPVAAPRSPLLLLVSDDGNLADFPAWRHLDPVHLSADGIGTAEALVLVLADGDDLARRAVQAIRAATAAMRRPLPIMVLGHGAFHLTATDEDPDPRWSTVAGLVLAAAQEYPAHDLRYLDVTRREAVQAVAAELALPRPAEPWSAWRDGRRFLRTFIPLSEKGTPNWPDQGVCVISGGNGGFAASLAATWSAGGRVALALLSRRGATPPENVELFADLSRRGVDVRSYGCDVTDADALARTLAVIRAEQGPITAVIHAAGIADGGVLAVQDLGDFDRVISVKMAGARNLDTLTAADPIRAFVLFASLTGVTGAPGLAAYAAANAGLDGFAAWRRRQGRVAQAIDWCSLRERGMAARTNVRMEDGWSMTPTQAVSAWKAILAGGAVQTVTIDAALLNDRQRLVPAPIDPTIALEDRIAVIWAKILGYPEISVDDDFFAIGGDSLTGMKIAGTLSGILDRSVTLTDLFKAATPRAMAMALAGAGTAPRAGDPAESQDEGGKTISREAVVRHRAPPSETYPLSWEQRAVLYSEDAAEQGTAFNLPHVIELPADVDLGRLRAALTQLVTRHAALRTRLERWDESWRMRPVDIAAAVPTLIPIGVPGDPDLTAIGRRWIRRFALDTELPVHWELLRTQNGRFALFFDIHHSLADGFAIETLLTDLSQLYAGHPTPAPRADLLDYGWWSQTAEAEAGLAEARAYWQRIFTGVLPILDLPADRPRPPRHTHQIGLHAFALEDDLVTDMRAFAAAGRTTPFTVILTAWAILLHRLAATSDVVIAIPVDSRNATGFDGAVGMMASLLPLRLKVSGDVTTSDLLRSVQECHTEAIRHRAYDLGRLMGDLAPAAAPERTPLSEVSLSYMNYGQDAADSLEAGGFTLHGLSRDSGKNDLSIFVRDLPRGINVSIEYYSAMFSAERLDHMGRMFRSLLGEIIHRPEAPVERLALLDQDCLDEILRLEEGPTPDLPLGRGLFALFAEQAARTPAAPAVCDDDGCWSYDELLRHATAIAGTLHDKGVKPDDWIAMHVERGRLAVAVTLGIVAAGAGYVPLDPSYPEERNRWILDDAAAGFAVVDATGNQALRNSGVVLIEATAGTPVAPVDLDEGNGDDDRPVYLMYTSGSTGRPKGVAIPQRAILRLVFGDDDIGLSASDRVAQAGPLAFDAATYEIWGPLLKGACACVIGRDDLLDPAALKAALFRQRVSTMFITTSLFNRQIDDDPLAFRGLQSLVAGGETLSPPHVRRLLEACPDLPLFNGYGPTEVTTFSLIHRIVATDVLPDGLGIPIGRPIAHTRAVILDAGGQRAPIGVWGELFLGGLGLAPGYWRNAALTAERFVVDPMAADRRLYRTGDRARWLADGSIAFGGRLDSQIKLRGHRIELAEIERVLADAPGVAQAAVILASATSGDGELLACIVAEAKPSPTVASLRAWTAKSLPRYMVPARWLYVDALPLTANGKLDTAALLARLPDARIQEQNDDEPVTTAAERMVAQVFTEIFQRPITWRTANFTDLGGHSLMAIRIVNRLAQLGGTRIPMTAFFADPTVAGLAGHFTVQDDGADPTGPAIRPAPPAAFYPASHGQQRLFLLQSMAPDSAAYVMLFAFHCSGLLSADILGKALALLATRHETLRTGFTTIDGRIVQRVGDGLPVLVECDLRGHADPRAEALRLARREATTPFDLGRPPLLRGQAIRLADDESLVLLALHHIVGDGWSAGILVDELSLFYAALADGRTPRLPPLPITYKDYAAWQTGHDWRAEEAIWRQRLAGAPTEISLPTDRPPSPIQSFRGGAVHRELPPALTAGMHALAEKHGASMAAVGLAVFAAVLYRLTRQGDMVIGMGVAGRDHIETEGLIGFFVNVLPIRIRLGDETDFGDLIDAVKDTVIAALDCRDYPFDLLVRAIAPHRSGNRQPLLNVVFEYHRFEGVRDPGKGGLPTLPPGHQGRLGDDLSEIIDSRTTKHDLIAFFDEEAGEARLTLEYDTDLFDAATMEKWQGYFATFAEMAITSSNGTAPP